MKYFSFTFLLLTNFIICDTNNQENKKEEIFSYKGYVTTFNMVIDPEVIAEVRGKLHPLFGFYTIHIHPLLYSALKGDNKPHTMDEYTKNISDLLHKNKTDDPEKLYAKCREILLSGLSTRSAQGIIAHEWGHIVDWSFWYEFFLQKRTQAYYHKREFDADAYAVKSSKSNAEGLVELFQKKCYLDSLFNLEYPEHPNPCERLKRALAQMNELYPEQKAQS